jgi:hypothetical protein
MVWLDEKIVVSKKKLKKSLLFFALIYARCGLERQAS